ncbi:MAG: NAD(P)/FAD-dependent oxidoreductase [Gluconacetobacter diazotrophicus]|nr:NAD(P)/FAD-dependent oxidoreductase [Gluconacetobacter diazotrophicus]
MSPNPEISTYDFVVLGGGSAGYAAARTAAGLGLRVAVVEGGREVGGLCILRGCMPSKTMIESANRFVSIRRAREFGLRAEDTRVVAPEILARKRRLVKEFADYRAGQLEHGQFDFIRGLAHFTGEHRVAIRPLKGLEYETPPPAEIEARTFLIATGSRIADVPIPGLEEAGYLTSDEALELDEYPSSILVLGAGAIGLEAAHQLAGLGCEVSVIQRCGQIMRDADEDVAGALQRALAGQGIRFHCGTHLVRAELDPATGQKRVWYERDGGMHSHAAQEILFALGRQPCTDSLELHSAGVETGPKGAVKTGDDQRSSKKHIFAAGDVCGPYEIVHIAIQQAEVAARNAARHLGKLGGTPEKTDYRLKLFALFTEPQMALVGLTEKEARAQGIDHVAATYPFADHGKAMVRGETEGFVKLISDRGTGEIIGGAAVGLEAAELIHEVVVAMHFHGRAADLAAVPHYHPTLSEIWTYPAEELAGQAALPLPGSL